jgi:hypothetical protein
MSTVSSTQALIALARSASPAAKAGLALKDFPTLVDETRKALDALLGEAAAPSVLKGGKPVIDLGTLDRRQALVIAVNGGDRFTADEQATAALDLQRRFSADLVSSAATARFSGLDNLIAAGRNSDTQKLNSQWLSAMALSRDNAVFAEPRGTSRADRNTRRPRSVGEFLSDFQGIANGSESGALLGTVIDPFASSGSAGWSRSSYATALQNYRSTSKFLGFPVGENGTMSLLAGSIGSLP